MWAQSIARPGTVCVCLAAQAQPGQPAMLQASDAAEGRCQQQAVVGFACALLVAGEAQLENVAVMPGHQGRGFGRQLLLALLQVRTGSSSSLCAVVH